MIRLTEDGELVRNRVPDIVDDDGVDVETHTAEGDEEVHRMCRQLRCAVDSFAKSGEVTALADVLDLVERLEEVSDLDPDEIEAVRDVKENQLGSYSEGVVIEECSGVDEVVIE